MQQIAAEKRCFPLLHRLAARLDDCGMCLVACLRVAFTLAVSRVRCLIRGVAMIAVYHLLAAFEPDSPANLFHVCATWKALVRPNFKSHRSFSASRHPRVAGAASPLGVAADPRLICVAALVAVIRSRSSLRKPSRM